MKHVKHWQDPANVLLGIWLVVSPWVLGFQGETVAMVNTVVVGLVLGAVALGATLVPQAWEEWSEAALGVWLAASAWILGFAMVEAAMVNAVLSGIVIAVLSMWVLMTDKDYLGWMETPAH